MESGMTTDPVEIGAAVGTSVVFRAGTSVVGTSIGADGERLLGSRLIGTDGVGIGVVISPL